MISSVPLQKLFRGENDLTLFLVINGCQPAAEAVVSTHSHLDKHQNTPVCRYQVDFTQALPVVAFDDAQAMRPQPCCGDQLGDAPFEICAENQVSLQGVAGDSISR